MDDSTPRPTLLSAAKNFMRKSAGTALLAIAPLAAVSVAPEAKAQTIFTQPPSGGSLQSTPTSGTEYGFFSGGGTFFADSYLTNGIRLVRNATYVANGSSGGFSTQLTFGLNAGGNVSPGLAYNQGVDYTYDFTLSLGSGATLNNWSLQAQFTQDGTWDNQIVTLTSGSGTGQQTGSGSFLTPLPSNDFYAVFLMVDVSINSGTPNVALLMNSGAGQGVTLNAAVIPESSTYASLFGVCALGFVMLRRSRRCAA
jgi:hypothetical protein